MTEASPAFKNLPPVAYEVTPEEREAIEAAIDKDELTRTALELGNIDSPSMQEASAAEYVFD